MNDKHVINHYKNMMIYVNEEHKFVYTSVPKSGCSSILGSFAPAFNLVYINNGGIGIHEAYHQHSIKYPQILLSSYDSFNSRGDLKKVLQVLLTTKYFKFTCLRDPKSRFLSGFFDKIISVKQNSKKVALPFCESAVNKTRDDNIEEVFVDFLKYVASTEDMKRDVHFRTQYNLTLVDVIPYDKIFMLETLEKDFNFLSNKFPQIVPLERFNKTSPAYGPLRQYLGEKYESEIYKIYQKDYEMIDMVINRK